MKELLSIGEMSEIFSIPKATLRFYDSIGLFKPVKTDKATGYRYYSPEQFEKLTAIINLSALEVPLKEIMDITLQMNLDSYLELLVKQSKLAQERAENLLLIKSQLDIRISEIKEALSVNDIDAVSTKMIDERNIIRVLKNVESRVDLIPAINELVKLTYTHFDKAEFTISKSDLLAEKFDTYNSVFITLDKCVIPEKIKNDDIVTIPAGKFAYMYYRASHANSAPYFMTILEYIKNNNYEVSGDAIRRVIIGSGMSKDNSNFLAEIQVPIQERTSKK